MREACAFKRIAARALAWCLVLGMLAACAVAQEDDDRKKATSFIDSIAQTTYALAWPTATYKRVSIDGFEPAQDGFNVIVKLSGLSGFDQSDLWVKLEFVFRNGELQDVRVRDHNAILMPPFATMKALGSLAVQLAKDYEKQHPETVTRSAPPPQYTPPVQAKPQPAPEQPLPSEGSSAPAVGTNDGRSSQPAATSPETDDGNSQSVTLARATGVASDIRAYLVASGAGFSSFTSGEPTPVDDGFEWKLNPPPGAKGAMSCTPIRFRESLVGCSILRSNKKNLDLLEIETEIELSGTLPPGWKISRHNGWFAVDKFDYASLTGPGKAWAAILAVSASDDSGADSYWLIFQVLFQ